MKDCSMCGRAYPDEYEYCEDDATRLAASSPSSTVATATAAATVAPLPRPPAHEAAPVQFQRRTRNPRWMALIAFCFLLAVATAAGLSRNSSFLSRRVNAAVAMVQRPASSTDGAGTVPRAVTPGGRIGFLTGHDESSVDHSLPYLSRIIQEGSLGYTITTINLNGGDNDVPTDIKGLVILNPSLRIEERELRRINGYLMRGGSVAVFASGVNTTGSDTRPSASRNEHNLNALLEGYGVTLNSDVVLDHQGMDAIQEIGTGRVRIPMFAYPALLAQREPGGPGINVAHPSVFRLPLVVTPFVSSLTVNESRAQEHGTQLTVVGRTAVRSVTQRENFELNAVELIERRASVFAPANGPHTVAVALEGLLRSAFTPEGAQTLTQASASRPARLLVVGSGKLFGIEQLRSIAPIQGGVPTNVQMLLNVFGWL